MKLRFLGAAGEVTGSCTLLETDRARILVDAGMFQGSKEAFEKNTIAAEVDPANLDAVLVTHGHLDHTGRLPLLVKRGYRGPFFATEATVDMAELVLKDTARLQEHDLVRVNRRRAERGQPPIDPLYDEDEVARFVRQCRKVPYGKVNEVAPGISARYVEAGHMLGSASIAVTVEEGSKTRSLIFSGDIGPRGAAILRDPTTFRSADAVLMESTYGDRDHRPLADTLTELREIIVEAVKRKGKILVPAFAIGRTQQFVYYLADLFRDKVVEPFPVWVDSPMAIEASAIYREHTELFDEEALELFKSGRMARDTVTVRQSRTADESKQLNDAPGPMLIIAGSGMCEGGRIVHHLKHNLANPETTVIIVGFQAENTLGRRLVEKRDSVKIFGEPVPVRAQIRTLGGFSAHAGQTELLEWFAPLADDKPTLILNHGEARGRDGLSAAIRQRFGIIARLPKFNEVIDL